MSLNHATLRLFKAVMINKDYGVYPSEAAAAATLPKGFIFEPDVTHEHRYQDLLPIVDQLYGRDGEQLNAGFHKSFATVRNAELVDLYVQQVLHYLTTYGRGEQGHDRSYIYIPAERLDVPDLEGGFRIVVIRGLTPDELRTELVSLLISGVALSEQSVADAIEIAGLFEWPDESIAMVKNREVQTALYTKFNLVPSRPEDFVRFLVYTATGRTQVVKNAGLYADIKATEKAGELVWAFNRYEKRHGLENLASVFNRYKPVFLAMRVNVSLKKYVNRLRRLAVEHHRPLPEDTLNAVTARIKNLTIDPAEFAKALEGATFFRKARLAYALQFRTLDTDSIAYRVRNGKTWATGFEPGNAANRALSLGALEDVKRSLIADLEPKVSGKKVFIPNGVTYGLPSSEKNFTGNIPAGTTVSVPNNMVVGVHWFNGDGNKMVDLDLSMTSADGKIGWDGVYRDEVQGIHFSGDVTNAPAPKGASEVFHISADARGAWLLNLNYYNSWSADGESVPFKIVVGQDGRGEVNHNYLIDPNKVVASAPSAISGDEPQKMLGIVVADDDSTRFIFSESQLGSAVSARAGGPAEQSRKFLLAKALNPIGLNNLLYRAGAEFVESPEDADFDLSLEEVDKSTLLSLLA